jgi:hypothetical protein
LICADVLWFITSMSSLARLLTPRQPDYLTDVLVVMLSMKVYLFKEEMILGSWKYILALG